MTALSCALSQPREIPIVGAPKAADTLAVLAVARGGYDPFQVVALGDALAPAAVPLPQERTQIDGRAAAYVCVDFACQLPVTKPATLRMRLENCHRHK